MTAETGTPHTGKVALVTGASRGIGAHLSQALLADGWRVAGSARSADRLHELVTEHGDAVLPLALDVTDVDQVGAAVAQVVGAFGRIDLLVNNAGAIEPEQPLWQADPEQWWGVIETNVRGPFLLCRAVVPVMLDQGGGRVVNINSGAGTRENADLTAYTASKSALARITGGLHRSAFDRGLRAFDLAPGVVDTDMTRSMRAHEGRTEWTDPAEVAALLLALASGELDAFSGRMVRAGADSVEALLDAAAGGLADDARMIRLLPWGPGDPLA